MYESFDWDHGVFIGAAMKSEATAAAEHKGKVRAKRVDCGEFSEGVHVTGDYLDVRMV